MPRMTWLGKEAVLDLHRRLPVRLLESVPSLAIPGTTTPHRLIEGDNLEALRALIPTHHGRVACITIDPPYNTGNENWVYNDAVNSPVMRSWLGKTIGKTVGKDDLTRHDKWLCMMYPRLMLMQQLLSEDGSLWVFLDDHEIGPLRLLLDEVFGPDQFIATVIWQKVYAPKNSARHFSEDHDYIVVYAKNAARWRPNLIPRTDEQDKAYKNPDKDPRGVWKAGDLSARNAYRDGTYAITCPGGRVIAGPPTGSYWRVSADKLVELDQDNRIWWGKDKNSVPAIKRFLSEVKAGVTPQTLWTYDEVGHTQEAKKELVELMDFRDSAAVFISPKPLRLMERIITIASKPGDIILDAFAGSGTTGHAVMRLNHVTTTPRSCILMQLGKDQDQGPHICQTITRERLLRASMKALRASVKEQRTGKKNKSADGWEYQRLGPAIIDNEGRLADMPYDTLADVVWWHATGGTRIKSDELSAYIGTHAGTAIYLLHGGPLPDKDSASRNALNSKMLTKLHPHDGAKIIYGAVCRLSADELRQHQITFRQIPGALESLGG
jgi:adenine-specific DNA-methyltransferase